jgi:ankyrin repeat protein
MARADQRAAAELILAAERGDSARVTAQLAAGVAVDVRDARGRTALLVATRADRIETARLLIAAGADVNAKDAIHDSPFLYAGAEGRNEILRLLLATGRVDLASTNRYGGTALIPAAHHGHVETVRILLGTAINIDHVNNLGWTALLETVILGDGGATHTEILRLLIEAGADVTIADRDGVTALAHARNRGFAAMADTLAGAGAR